MAQRNSSGRGATATGTKRRAGNRTPNTPGISESEISRMKVDDIRGQLRRRGVAGISALRKPELVKTLARTLRAEGGGAARRGTGPAGRAPARKTATKKAAAARTTGARKATRAKAAPAPARKAAAPRKTTTAAARRSTTTRAATGAKAAPAKAAKSTTTRAKAAPARAKAAPARAKAAPARKAAAPAAGARTGRSTARSVRSSQLISSPADRPERPGRSLVTTNHDVIRNWARARGARPATIAGTEREGRPGVLTFEIPGYRESSRVQVITWDDWFRTFDARRLNLIYQEQLRDGRQSNFFRTESPEREDA
ncbi:hypothetical protein [Micromonospora coxensis]|uniref:Rho termination factor, N-terminal domain n=1 Tax=Micromonospora coxensis TaxID=356852 RepID=A0A1C5IFT7_9ACTN|nr:hypothetical protein [Micromonospora coxensis]SCG56889.1 hypothetical protein GA0070614_2692 [Micromonospora coxensis]